MSNCQVSKSRGIDMEFEYEAHDDNSPYRFDELYQKKWLKLHETPGIFRYKLNIINEKILSGKHGFLLQLNIDRATNRRLPEEIRDVNQTFDDTKFNFNKVSEDEYIMKLIDDDSTSNNILMVNTSPICFGHSLLCPEMNKCLPQIITFKSLKLISTIMFLSSDTNLRAGFNSLCGMASVNHLHYHLFILNYRLPIESVKCINVSGPLYKLNSDYPAKGYCFQIKNKKEIPEICCHIYRLITLLMENNKAHNLYLTKGDDFDVCGEIVLRIFLWVRSNSCGAKEISGFNLAICEFSGQFPVKNENDYGTLTEEYIIKTLEETTCQEFLDFEHMVNKLY